MHLMAWSTNADNAKMLLSIKGEGSMKNGINLVAFRFQCYPLKKF